MLRSAPIASSATTAASTSPTSRRRPGSSRRRRGQGARPVLPFDYDGDGKLDLYVANERRPQLPLVNKAGRTDALRGAGRRPASPSRARARRSRAWASDVADVDGDPATRPASRPNFGKESEHPLRPRPRRVLRGLAAYPCGLGDPSTSSPASARASSTTTATPTRPDGRERPHRRQRPPRSTRRRPSSRCPTSTRTAAIGHLIDSVGPRLSPFFTKPEPRPRPRRRRPRRRRRPGRALVLENGPSASPSSRTASRTPTTGSASS
jgi:hypothetical protein